jgi:hypothetical protein
MAKMLNLNSLKKAIARALTPDLLSTEWRARVGPDKSGVAGHCAVASEAFYYLAGGKKAGFTPVVCSYKEGPRGGIYFPGDKIPKNSLPSTHWWIRRGDEIFDVTAAQYKLPFPYEHGRGTGFMQPQRLPSRRAAVVMARVEKELGAGYINTLRRSLIKQAGPR